MQAIKVKESFLSNDKLMRGVVFNEKLTAVIRDNRESAQKSEPVKKRAKKQ